MTNHINNTIGKPQDEIIAYFQDKHFSLDQLFEFRQACEQEISECERNINSLGYTYRDESGFSTYGSNATDGYADEQAERARDLQLLADIAEDYYNDLAA